MRLLPTTTPMLTGPHIFSSNEAQQGGSARSLQRLDGVVELKPCTARVQ